METKDFPEVGEKSFLRHLKRRPSKNGFIFECYGSQAFRICTKNPQDNLTAAVLFLITVGILQMSLKASTIFCNYQHGKSYDMNFHKHFPVNLHFFPYLNVSAFHEIVVAEFDIFQAKKQHRFK